jgi:3-keto-5-aminohexanoate cleavage enzyme
MSPLVICAAVTGGAKAKTPHHPVTPAAVVQSALECWRAGAAMIHLHARRDDGSTTTDLAAYRALVESIRSAGCDAILNLSAGDDGGRASHAQRLAVAQAGAEVVSLDAGPINIAGRIYDNSPDYLQRMSAEMTRYRVKAAVEIFDYGHLEGLRKLAANGALQAPHFVEFVMGVPGGLPTDARLLPMLVEALPENSHWCVSCQTSDPAVYREIMLWVFSHGGHVRTGMEDIIWAGPDRLAQSNAELVEQWTRTAAIWGRSVATPAQARAMLGLVQGDGQ